MKQRILTVFFIMLFAHSLFAQNDDYPQTLVGNGIESVSGFGGMMLQFSSIDGNAAVFTGGGGAVLFNRQFFFGGYGLGLTSDVSVDIEGAEYDLNYGHGGFYLGYIFAPEKLGHLAFSTKLGWGQADFNNRSVFVRPEFVDNTFSITPMLEGELNVSNWFKINAGVGYQYTVGVDNDLFDNNAFNSPAVGLSFLFGWFN
ncbi:MAG: hypothetical protein AAGC88_05950 [Bacteroidota bacterium]